MEKHGILHGACVLSTPCGTVVILLHFLLLPTHVSIRQHPSAYVSIHTSASVSIRQHPSASVSIRQHTPAYASIRQHTSALYLAIYTVCALLALKVLVLFIIQIVLTNLVLFILVKVFARKVLVLFIIRIVLTNLVLLIEDRAHVLARKVCMRVVKQQQQAAGQ
jgi:hypothetical protein